jgi:MoaA/NifB/PqqE/SkfB family radical SAM enzyme
VVKFIQIEVTTRCNFQCAFCCGRHMKQADMTFDTYKQIIDSLPMVDRVQLQGEGEPFLHKDIYDMIAYAKRKNIVVQTITNGSFFTKDNIPKILESGIDIIHVSLESANEETYKKYRGAELKDLVPGIDELIKRRNEQKLQKPLLGFAVTVTKETKNMLPEIFQLYRDINMDAGIQCQTLQEDKFYTQYYNDELSGLILSKAEKSMLMHNYALLMKDIYINNAVESMEDYSKRINQLEPSRGTCLWLRHGLYINVFGYATACCRHKDYEISAFGKIEENSIESILKNREQAELNFQNGIFLDCCKEHISSFLN